MWQGSIGFYVVNVYTDKGLAKLITKNVWKPIGALTFVFQLIKCLSFYCILNIKKILRPYIYADLLNYFVYVCIKSE